jgi:deoxyuridine 5'-triphosphate nucleotidohydrolase
MQIKIKLDEGAIIPKYAHTWDGGMDLFAAERKVVRANDFEVIETGVHIEIPEGYVGLITSKSGLMAKHGLTCRGTIDSHYTGSIKAVVFNHSKRDYIVEKEDKVTQLVILKCEHPQLQLVDELEDTDRSTGGFGSTGR